MVDFTGCRPLEILKNNCVIELRNDFRVNFCLFVNKVLYEMAGMGRWTAKTGAGRRGAGAGRQGVGAGRQGVGAGRQGGGS